jgi:hypothetical protein
LQLRDKNTIDAVELPVSREFWYVINWEKRRRIAYTLLGIAVFASIIQLYAGVEEQRVWAIGTLVTCAVYFYLLRNYLHNKVVRFLLGCHIWGLKLLLIGVMCVMLLYIYILHP